jgi:hypothetical protein
MEKRAPGTAPFRVVLALMVASLACSNPIQSYFSTQAANRDTATAAMFTLTATETNTRRPTRTGTPSITPTRTRTKTKTLASTDTPLPMDTLADGSGTAPAPAMRTKSQTGPAFIQPNRFIETAGLTKFSYVPPSDWEKVPASGGDLTNWNLPSPKGAVACTLAFSTIKSNSTASEYAKILLDGLSNTEGIRLLSQGKFVNDGGLDAYKLVVVLSSQGSNVQIAVYLFQKRGYLIMGAYGRLTEQSKEQDAIVDASLRTIRYE